MKLDIETIKRHGWDQNIQGQWVQKKYLDMAKKHGFNIRGLPLSEVTRIVEHDEHHLKMMRNEI